MSYTAEDLAAIERAIIEFGTGDRVGSVTCDGEKIEYSQVTMSDLLDLKNRIAGSLKPKRKRYVNIYTDKGLH